MDIRNAIGPTLRITERERERMGRGGVREGIFFPLSMCMCEGVRK